MILNVLKPLIGAKEIEGAESPKKPLFLRVLSFLMPVLIVADAFLFWHGMVSGGVGLAIFLFVLRFVLNAALRDVAEAEREVACEPEARTPPAAATRAPVRSADASLRPRRKVRSFFRARCRQRRLLHCRRHDHGCHRHQGRGGDGPCVRLALGGGRSACQDAPVPGARAQRRGRTGWSTKRSAICGANAWFRARWFRS